MSEFNKKKAELQEIDRDLQRLTFAVRQFDEFDGVRKIVVGGLGFFLVICGVAGLAGSYFLATNSGIHFIYAGASLIFSLICIFLGIYLLICSLRLWFILSRATQIIAQVEERKTELEREIALCVER